MINIDSFNKSTVRQSEIDELLQKIKSRLDSIDFTPFGIESYFVHVVLDADNDSLKLSTPMSNEKRFIHFQSIPKNVTFASSFEAKLTTIRLRLQNLPILFESEIKKLFKIYSKIILWQRYAAWLRACQPCIHNQWSVS